MLRSKLFSLLLAVLALGVSLMLVASGTASADDDLAYTREGKSACQFANGLASPFTARSFECLLERYGADVVEDLGREVSPLDATNFHCCRGTSAFERLFGEDGDLQPPPGLTGVPGDSMARAQHDFATRLFVVVEKVLQREPVTADELKSLRSLARAWTRQTKERDVETVIYARRVREFVAHLGRSDAHDRIRDLMQSGSPPASFGGGTVGDLIGWMSHHELAPSLGSAASRYLSPVAASLARADAAAEQQTRKEQVERATESAKLASIRRQARAAGRASRQRQRPVRTRIGGPATGVTRWFVSPRRTSSIYRDHLLRRYYYYYVVP